MENRSSGSFVTVFAVILVLALAVFGVGVYLVAKGQTWSVLAAGCVAVVAVLSLWAFALHLWNISHELIEHNERLTAPINERLQHLSVTLNMVSEQQLISERAKAIAFRENERDALRRAIQDDIAKRDWEAALVLANDIEALFGYKQEAERFRQQILSLRQEDVRKTLGEANAVIDRFCRSEQWAQALQEAERILKIFPDEPLVRTLPEDIEKRRQSFKQQLLDGWHEAVARHDVDGSIEILTRLDLYLSSDEAQTIKDTARQVFNDKLQQLGQEFTLSVKGRQWSEAIQTGEIIVRDFPNSRMAQEVSSKMEILRQAASEPQGAQV